MERTASLRVSWEDMVKMEEVNEATILHNLKYRFQNGDIYTNIGRILVSLNPFDWETSEVYFNSDWVSTFQNSTPDEPVRCVSRLRQCSTPVPFLWMLASLCPACATLLSLGE